MGQSFGKNVAAQWHSDLCACVPSPSQLWFRRSSHVGQHEVPTSYLSAVPDSEKLSFTKTRCCCHTRTSGRGVHHLATKGLRALRTQIAACTFGYAFAVVFRKCFLSLNFPVLCNSSKTCNLLSFTPTSETPPFPPSQAGITVEQEFREATYHLSKPLDQEFIMDLNDITDWEHLEKSFEIVLPDIPVDSNPDALGPFSVDG